MAEASEFMGVRVWIETRGRDINLVPDPEELASQPFEKIEAFFAAAVEWCDRVRVLKPGWCVNEVRLPQSSRGVPGWEADD